MRLPGGSKFQEVYEVVLEEPLRWGDCGVGVFDASTGDIYGHVVATSAAKDVAYIMPATLVSDMANISWKPPANQVLDAFGRQHKLRSASLDASTGCCLEFKVSTQKSCESHYGGPKFMDTDDVFTYIQRNLVQTTFRGEQQRFLRKLAFDEITTKQTIHLVAAEDEALFLDEDDLGQFVGRVARDGKRLFATCVQGSLPMTCLQLLLESGLTDASMPLTEEDFPGRKFKRSFVGSFLPNQALFNTAYFHLDSIQDLSGLTKPIDHDETKMIGKGAFGAVYTVKIHVEHRSFPSVGSLILSDAVLY